VDAVLKAASGHKQQHTLIHERICSRGGGRSFASPHIGEGTFTILLLFFAGL
jgi:hypothetical protein